MSTAINAVMGCDGTRYFQPTDHYQIGREEIRGFARSVKDAHLVHWDESVATDRGHPSLVAPLTYSARLGGIALNWLMNNVLVEYDTSGFIQTDQLFIYHRPLHAGEETMGIGSAFITSWLGDPTAMRDYRVRFTGIAYVADDAPAADEYAGRIKTIDHQAKTAKTTTIAITATTRGRRIFGRASATVQLR